jgi:hypothetical protein
MHIRILFTILTLISTVPPGADSFTASRSLTGWQNAALQGVRDAKLGAPVAARVLAIVDTCMYDVWAAYDGRALGTQLGRALRRPLAERTLANKERAISYAAYLALSDVLPVDTESVYKPLMKELGYDPNDTSTDIETPTGIGNVACAAVLEYRHHDKSNQLGDLAQGAYADWSEYKAANPPASVPARNLDAKALNPDHWQPLSYTPPQIFAPPGFRLRRWQWCFVTPFAMKSGEELRKVVEPGPALHGSAEFQEQTEEMVAISAGLTDKQKVIAEYWLDGPRSEQPPGHWMLLAQYISQQDHHTLDEDVKMYFALSNAMLDAGIAAWDAKRTYDSVRPVMAIEVLFKGKTIRAWGGPGKGTEMDGSQRIPYQLATAPTPPFLDYVSGHSTYSARSKNRRGATLASPGRSTAARFVPGIRKTDVFGKIAEWLQHSVAGRI